MKCTWFCNCAHLQDFSFFVCSLINCATGEFLGGADRKLAAPPAQSAVPWKCHCGALSLHFVHRRTEVGCGDAGSNAFFIFPFLSCPALLSCSSFNAHCMEHTFLTGWPSSEPGMILFSLSTPLLCWQSCPGHSYEPFHSWGKLLDFTPPFLPIPDIPLSCCQVPCPCTFPGYKHSGSALPWEWSTFVPCFVFALALGLPHKLSWSISFHSGHCSVTHWGLV